MLVTVRTLLIATVVLAVAGGIGLATTAALSPASDSAPLRPITVQTPVQRLAPPSEPPAAPPTAPPPPAPRAPIGGGPAQPDGVPAPPPPVTWSGDGDDDGADDEGADDDGGDDDGDGDD
jgi:hypothetical protein